MPVKLPGPMVQATEVSLPYSVWLAASTSSTILIRRLACREVVFSSQYAEIAPSFHTEVLQSPTPLSMARIIGLVFVWLLLIRRRLLGIFTISSLNICNFHETGPLILPILIFHVGKV